MALTNRKSITRLCFLQPAVAGMAYVPLDPRSVTVAPNNGVMRDDEL
tara:strand:- start:617 stop:757 length:141 start_codon:yes stop_codon:yes gene_type:complete